MSNKKQLQENNRSLTSILDSISNLPTVNNYTGSTNITPSTKNATIPAYSNKTITVLGDADLKSENIKRGINLFGITGTLSSAPNKIYFSSSEPTGSDGVNGDLWVVI